MSILDPELESELASLQRQSLRRTLRVIDSAHEPRVVVDGRRMLMLSSNNYLGLAAHPALRSAAIETIGNYGVGAGASRLVAGTLAPVSELERDIANLKGVEAALVFGAGYLANLGAITALAGPGDVILSDELNHASLIDGSRLSRAEIMIYRHRDIDHLAALLAEVSGARRRLIVTDSVFSMDGDFAPLAKIVQLARTHRAAVMIDEAHGVGVVGPRGAGLAAHLGLEREIDIHVGTLSKALGSYGAYVAGSRTLIDYLLNRSRSFIFSTGLPPALAAAASAAIRMMRESPGIIARLWDNAAYLRERLEGAGFRLGATESPILPVMIGESGAAIAMASALYERGVYVSAIRPPTVAPGTARLRVTPTAAHSRADLEEAAAAFISAGRELGLI
ncbi:MAG: 8-amino-7-oxononanoate synthase [Candidatus Binataceae bacterium]